MSATMSTNSFGFASPQSAPTCNICTRLLYTFEEILVCRICRGSYHWRCVKPETITHYGENAHFVCEKCHENLGTHTSNSSHRLANGGIRIKSPDSSETDYRNFVGIPSKFNGTPTKETSVINTVRYFEDKQQQQQASSSIPKNSKSNGHLNGQYTDDNKAVRRITQQQPPQPPTNFESDEDNNTTGMFQADYQYTPLKEYAAMKTNETNSYRTSPLSHSSNQFTSPTVDNLTVHNRQHQQQQHFISSTNVNSNELSMHHRQQPQNQSTPYLSSQTRDNPSPTFKTSYQQQQQQNDRHSNVGSDSGIVLTNDNPIIERKLTDLVQQLGKQLETDAQKLSEKLELKLKNLEYMIHQQTYIIRRQDEVIERLKSKILKIENERDHFRDRLSVHEQRELDEKKYPMDTQRKLFEHDDQQQTSNDVSSTRKFSTTSSGTTEPSRRSSKKTPAPRVDQHESSTIKNETESTVSKLISTVPTNQERQPSHSPNLSSTGRLIAAVPLTEKPAAATRLDDIIHQSDSPNEPRKTSYYNATNDQHRTELKPKRSSSASSSSSSSTSSSSIGPAKQQLPTTTTELSPTRNLNRHQSLESIPRRTSQNDRPLDLTNKTTSLEFGQRPSKYEDPGSIYITPQEATHPASQYQNTSKGWIRKQNRDSILKRVERYYCVISNNILLMHKNQEDTKPQKAVNLRGAKVVKYQDPRRGPALELTWTRRNRELKRYHLFDLTETEAQEWLTALQTAIDNLDNNKNLPSKDASETMWQRYRMQT